MNLCFRFLFPLCLIFILNGCSNEIDVLADYEENASVYALLDPAQNWQFIKINKVFTNPNAKAGDVARIADSLYFDTLQAEVIENETGRRMPLTRANIALKDSGTFANSPNYIYVTSERIFSNRTYRLEIKLPHSGKLITAYTNIPSSPGVYSPGVFLNIPYSATSGFNLSFQTAQRAKIYDAFLYFNYTEINKSDTNIKTDKTIAWKILRSYRSLGEKGNELVNNRINGIVFYELLLSSIPVNPAVTRKFRPCEFLLICGNAELDNYIQASTPSIGIVQKQSEYSNVNKGIGIFASRFTYYMNGINLTNTTKDLIVGTPEMKVLGFTK